jgi:hypothetical protein
MVPEIKDEVMEVAMIVAVIMEEAFLVVAVIVVEAADREVALEVVPVDGETADGR